MIFPFVVGVPRSGTTLLRAMLDSHPALAVPGESPFLVRLSGRRYARAGRFETERFLADLLAEDRFRRWGLAPGEVRRALLGPPPEGFADAVRRVYGAYATSRGKPRYADKTPGHVRHVGLLSRLFPEARFVHLIRDGRDVALSLGELGWEPRGLEAAAALWLRMVRAGRRAGRALGPSRYREVRYEELVADPRGELRSLCGFLDLDFDERMLDYPARAAEVLAPLRSPEAHRSLFLPPTRGLRDWRREMTPGNLARFESVAGPLLEELGYARGVRRPPLSAHVSARLRLGGSEVRTVLRRAGKRLRPKGRLEGIPTGG